MSYQYLIRQTFTVLLIKRLSTCYVSKSIDFRSTSHLYNLQVQAFRQPLIHQMSKNVNLSNFSDIKISLRTVYTCPLLFYLYTDRVVHIWQKVPYKTKQICEWL